MASCFLIITVIFYFIEILNSEKVLNVTRDLLFWISVGVVLFNIGVIPWVITLKHYSEKFVAMNTLLQVLILILNICYILGFICSYKIQKQETSQQ
jgi:quinol-cytochrome oxidoreductase complex cytochrome b subunit